jgi:hypothetical protein
MWATMASIASWPCIDGKSWMASAHLGTDHSQRMGHHRKSVSGSGWVLLYTEMALSRKKTWERGRLVEAWHGEGDDELKWV